MNSFRVVEECAKQWCQYTDVRWQESTHLIDTRYKSSSHFSLDRMNKNRRDFGKDHNAHSPWQKKSTTRSRNPHNQYDSHLCQSFQLILLGLYIFSLVNHSSSIAKQKMQMPKKMANIKNYYNSLPIAFHLFFIKNSRVCRCTSETPTINQSERCFLFTSYLLKILLRSHTVQKLESDTDSSNHLLAASHVCLNCMGLYVSLLSKSSKVQVSLYSSALFLLQT